MHPKKASLFVAGVLFASSLSAQTLEGPAIRVSSRQGSFPIASQAAKAANGDIAVVWEDVAANGSRRVWVRRLTASGRPKGREIPVDPSSPKAQQGDPRIAMAPEGGFFVVWDMGDQAFHNAVFGRSFAASGKPLGPAFRLNPGSQDAIELNPAVAAAPDGGFVATWTSGPNPFGFQNDDILVRRFTVDGKPAGGVFKAVDPAPYFQNDPRVAVSGNGDILIAWLSYQNASGPAQTELAARRFDAEGHPLGERFSVAGSLDILNGFNLVATDDGEALFVWRGAVPGAPPTASGLPQFGILGRRFTTGDAPAGAAFVIQEVQVAAPFEAPAVAVLPGGGYFVAWSGGDVFPSMILGQSLAGDGTSQGPAARINNDGTDKGGQPAVALGPDGRGVVTWTAFPRRSTSIFVRRLVP